MAQTYTIFPESGPEVVTITCNSITDAAQTAKVFFFTPCKIRDPDTEELISVAKRGEITPIHTLD